MKTTMLTSPLSGLSIMSLSLLLIVSFSIEVSAKRGCTNYGHSCFGGHGKRSNPDVAVNAPNVANLGSIENERTRNAEKCKLCVREVLSRNARDEQFYIPRLIEQMMANRGSYNIDMTPNDE